ncbi:hypothetical protein PR048_000895 [Dryococelus australis]|uniref:Uncharacterized protein n=1 Tax=Dryococelus australis TaxID=614101 RepID=A0ABQ9IFY8_9NEOP|nr:hypothetical protein PR048_000895 [Dryococelus australis]
MYKSQQELSRELMNQHVKDVLGGLGQESSDESSDVPALRPPVAKATPVQESVLGRDAPSVILHPVKNPMSKAAGPKKLPGLTRMLESDSDSLQLDANLATSNDESDDFDFSSEK